MRNMRSRSTGHRGRDEKEEMMNVKLQIMMKTILEQANVLKTTQTYMLRGGGSRLSLNIVANPLAR